MQKVHVSSYGRLDENSAVFLTCYGQGNSFMVTRCNNPECAIVCVSFLPYGLRYAQLRLKKCRTTSSTLREPDPGKIFAQIIMNNQKRKSHTTLAKPENSYEYVIMIFHAKRNTTSFNYWMSKGLPEPLHLISFFKVKTEPIFIDVAISGKYNCGQIQLRCALDQHKQILACLVHGRTER